MTSITTQYGIYRYVGNSGLNLMQPPSEAESSLGGVGNPDVSGVSIQSTNTATRSNNLDLLDSQWYQLVDNTLSIHSTQISDQSIPVYFTDLDQLNTNRRVPSTDSTLTQLDPGESYYFIMRSSADLPITLPEFGGSFGDSCSSAGPANCSNIGVEPISDTNLVGKDNNKQFVTVCVTGLTCGETYSYNFESSLSNWPTYVNAISGEFLATHQKMEIPAEITFSKETGNLDQTNLLDYKIYEDINYHPCKTEDFNVYSAIKVKIEPISYNGLGAEDLFKLHCIDCLPDCDPYATVKFVDAPLKQLALECCQETNNLVVDVRDARLGELYDYKIISDSLSNVSITPVTGTVSFGKYYAPNVASEPLDDAGGQFNMLFNLMENTEAILKVELTHRNTQIMSTDYLTVVCSGCV
tara:strand:- start:437 stop:1669 length:1233 start_codon:yes stop_codon:yes gene_type:complete